MTKDQILKSPVAGNYFGDSKLIRECDSFILNTDNNTDERRDVLNFLNNKVMELEVDYPTVDELEIYTYVMKNNDF